MHVLPCLCKWQILLACGGKLSLLLIVCCCKEVYLEIWRYVGKAAYMMIWCLRVCAAVRQQSWCAAFARWRFIWEITSRHASLLAFAAIPSSPYIPSLLENYIARREGTRTTIHGDHNMFEKHYKRCVHHPLSFSSSMSSSYHLHTHNQLCIHTFSLFRFTVFIIITPKRGASFQPLSNAAEWGMVDNFGTIQSKTSFPFPLSNNIIDE